MPITKNDSMYLTALAGLISANKGNPFWSQSDAMQLLNMTRKNSRKS